MSNEWLGNSFVYGIDVSRFCDGNNDGIGDFEGLISKIPYLAELGVSCIWLLPFYTSDRRDNGYDVVDYYHVDPRYGTLEDFQRFVHTAGEYGMRVIIDFVMNHTSNKHPWFQAARANAKSRYRNYYYWAAQPPLAAPGQETAFPGEEATTWTYDEVAGSYYHHRFYDFEPSLNAGHPLVQNQTQAVMDFWMSFGVSGFRLDAAAIMVESPVSPREKPIDRHDILRKLYKDAREFREDSVLIGEVNETPDEMRKFCDGTQMNGVFNFLLNQYMTLALATGKAEPLSRVFGLMPPPAKDSSWVNFLRNLDEANIVMLSDAEKKAVFKAFAPKENMRIYGRGIRRRLAPMMGGDMLRIKMAYSLLFAMPGAPNLVYGDEIGMGEDLKQEGRYSVRTLMQWSDKKHAGFSRSAKPKCHEPIISTGKFGFRNVNALRQMEDKESLWHHIRKLAKIRKEHSWVHFENFSIVACNHESVFVQCYRTQDLTLTIVHNLSNKKVRVTFDAPPSSGENFHCLWTEDDYKAEKGKLTLSLPPYRSHWLSSKRAF